jgi:hypothetical protein
MRNHGGVGRGCVVGRGLGVTLGAGVADGVGVGVIVAVGLGLGVGVGVGVDVGTSSKVSLKFPLLSCPPKRITRCKAASYVMPAPSRAGGDCTGDRCE